MLSYICLFSMYVYAVYVLWAWACQGMCAEVSVWQSVSSLYQVGSGDQAPLATPPSCQPGFIVIQTASQYSIKRCADIH